MWYPAELTFSNYIPLQIERGMFFKNNDNTLWEVNIPYKDDDDLQEFFRHCGYPVEPSIVTDNNLLALPEEIAWIESEGEMWKADVDDFNYILEECDGKILIKIEDEGEDVVPVTKEGFVIITECK